MREFASTDNSTGALKQHGRKQNALPGNNAVETSFFTNETPQLFRKSSCACGGGCGACQAKSSGLNISQPHDPAEIEADNIADKVMRMDSGDTKPDVTGMGSQNSIQRKCNDCEDEDTKIQRKNVGNSAAGDAVATAPSYIGKAISSGGAPLDLQTRNFFEPRLGYDLSSVRIHTGGAAAESAQSISAHAYTLGDHVVFNGGQFRPDTDAGKRLLAHELAHVGQQRSGKAQIQRAGFGDVRIMESYNETIADIKASAKYTSLAPNEQKLTDDIILEIEKIVDLSIRYSFALKLQVLFKPTATKELLTDAKTSILHLGLDTVKVTALLATLTKPFLGYVASGFDFESRFFRHAGSLGFKVENPALDSYKAGPYDPNQPASVTDPAEESFKKSDILFFSGHQYAQYHVPGNFTNKDSDSCFNISMLSKENKRVKLVASTGCATICKDVAKIWMKKFPDALILGYRFSAPTNGAIVANAFARQMLKKGPIDLSDASSLQMVRDAWKSVVLGKGSVGGGPALLYGGEVEFWSGGKWIKKPWDDKANECHYH